jgi:transposase InsO family protein
MKFTFIAEHSTRWSIRRMCILLKVSRQGFHQWRGRETSQRYRENRILTGKILNVFLENKGRYGSPRVWRALRARGSKAGRHRVARLMRKAGLRAKTRRAYRVTTQSKHTRPIYKNLLNREFITQEMNEKWTTDITYIALRNGNFAYLACVLDLYSRKLVGWSLSSKMRSELVCDALRNAVLKRAPDAGLVIHSDRGSQYASKDYQDLLTDFEMTPSMSRKGNCWDNAPMESFFRSLKMECIYGNKPRNLEDARKTLEEYIDDYYNRKRMHSTLGYLSPVEYEQNSTRLGVN